MPSQLTLDEIWKQMIADIGGSAPTDSTLQDLMLTYGLAVAGGGAGGSGTFFNVKDAPFNATGNGVTDDTAAIQSAINAAEDVAGTVYFPGVAAGAAYKFTNLVVSSKVRLLGDGWTQAGQAPFGPTNYPLSGSMGSVLYCIDGSGEGISWAGTGGQTTFGIEHLLVVGPGTGTSVGLNLSSSGLYLTQGTVIDVEVCNFSTCWACFGIEDSTFIGWRSRGCHTGMTLGVLGTASNQNTFISTEVQFSDTDGIVVTNSLANNWQGMLFQNCSGNSSLQHASGENNVYNSVYLENTDLPTYELEHTSGSYNCYSNWYEAEAGFQIVINGGANNTIRAWEGSGGTCTVNTGNINRFEDAAMTLAGAGAATQIVDNQTIYSTPADVYILGTLNPSIFTPASLTSPGSITGNTVNAIAGMQIGNNTGLDYALLVCDAATGNENGLQINNNGNPNWLLYDASSTSLFLRDAVNGVMMLTFQQGAAPNGRMKMGGRFYPVQAPTASAPTYELGAMYFDTTLNKLRIGGATGWETVTSV